MVKCHVCDSVTAVQKHHLTYFPETTIAICEGCHKKIHSNKHPYLTLQYIKYKKGDSKLFYSQQKRIDGFLHRFHL